MVETERFNSGTPLTFAMKGVDELSSSQKRSHKTLVEPIKQEYGTSMKTDTARVIKQLNNAVDPVPLMHATRAAGLHEVEDYERVIPDEKLADLNTDNPDLSDVMQLIDVKITESHCPREKDASKVCGKTNRDTIYVPNLVKDEGTVYMAKTLSSTGKLRMAWDLHPENEVVVVDEYEKWENLLGWEKLKQFPHGKNKIREQYGDQLSDELLDALTGNESGDMETKASDDDSDSRGRRTRTKPSEEVLNLALSSSHKKRSKRRSKDISETFDNDEAVSVGRGQADMLVLFPSTTDLLMSDHWWVAGSKPFGKGDVAIANCNKGTFEYLNQHENVWHIEDYLEQAGNYEFQTSAGPITMNTASTDNLVIHTLKDSTRDLFIKESVFDDLPTALHEYCEEEKYSDPGLPHEDDMVYAPITERDAFWLRPVLRKQNNSDEGDALIASGDGNSRDIVSATNISSDWSLYARARLNEWDFDSLEMNELQDCTGLYLSLDDAGYSIIETLGKLHDKGEKPYSQTPQSRWSQ